MQHSFLKWFRFPASIWSDENGGYDRIDYWHLYDLLRIGKGDPRNQQFLELQRKLRINRSYSHKLPSLHGGSGYWSLNRAAMAYVFDQTTKQPALLKRLRHCFCAEEIYIHTLLLNSPLASTLINDDLRYVDWESAKGEVYPAILDESGFDLIRDGSAFFVRNLDSKQSLRLGVMNDLLVGPQS